MFARNPLPQLYNLSKGSEVRRGSHGLHPNHGLRVRFGSPPYRGEPPNQPNWDLLRILALVVHKPAPAVFPNHAPVLELHTDVDDVGLACRADPVGAQLLVPLLLR